MTTETTTPPWGAIEYERALASDVLRTVRANLKCPEMALSHKTDVLEYRLTRDWRKLEFKDGAIPDVFVIKKLPREFGRKGLDAITNDSLRRVVAFQAAVHRVELGEGRLLTPEAYEMGYEDGIAGTKIAPIKWVENIADLWDDETVDEMGQLAIDWMRMRKGGVGPFSFRRG